MNETNLAHDKKIGLLFSVVFRCFFGSILNQICSQQTFARAESQVVTFGL